MWVKAIYNHLDEQFLRKDKHVYKFGRLYGHTRDKTIFLLVKNASKRKISFSDVKTGHMCYFFLSEIFLVYFNHLDEEFHVSLENYN